MIVNSSQQNQKSQQNNPQWYWLPEWASQVGVLLAWPHAGTDWAEQLPTIRKTYLEIILAIAQVEQVFLLVPSEQEASDFYTLWQAFLLDQTKPNPAHLHVITLPYNDTWLRDTGPLSLTNQNRQGLKLLNFSFNGWGGKFEATLDNTLSARLMSQTLFTQTLPQPTDFEKLLIIAEGGNLETNGQGVLLTQKSCLLHPNRKNALSENAWEALLREKLGVNQFWWLEHGMLCGDDTDGHIDTLARFASEDKLLYQSCNEPNYPFYDSLQLMQQELEHLCLDKPVSSGSIQLTPLPWPDPVYNLAGERLPATYANFLILNGRVLVPTYGVKQDANALEIMTQSFPNHEIVPINAINLIAQGGSIHCATMQIHASCG